MKAAALAWVLLAATLPSTSKTGWMTPDAFRLSVGMRREAAITELKRSSWNWKKGKLTDEVVLTYEEGKTVTLKFGDARLKSIRFELVGFIPTIKQGFTERADDLTRRLGPGKKLSSSVISYERRAPYVMMVSSTGTETSYGRQGLGFLVVRYFEPPPR